LDVRVDIQSKVMTCRADAGSVGRSRCQECGGRTQWPPDTQSQSSAGPSGSPADHPPLAVRMGQWEERDGKKE